MPIEIQEEKHEQKHKRINNIHSFMVHENELCLGGTDEHGEDLTIWFDCYDFLEWIDTENLEYIKERLSKYIKEK